jgi:hypothetical protein
LKLGGEEIDECADLVAWRSSRRQRVEIGVIGVGKWALTGPIRIFDLLAQSEISAIYSQRLDAAHDAAAKYNIKNVVASLDDLVNHPDIDLVLVLTTGQQLEVAVRAAIAAGKTVYCEWPLTPSAKASAEWAALAGSAGVRTSRHPATLLTGFRLCQRSARRGLCRSGPLGSDGCQHRYVWEDTASGRALERISLKLYGRHLHFWHPKMDPLLSVVALPTGMSALSVNQWPGSDDRRDRRDDRPNRFRLTMKQAGLTNPDRIRQAA